MYDFFDRQEAARTSTRWLVFLFLLAVAAIVLAVYGAVVLALLWATGEGGPAIGEHGVLGILWRPEVFVWAAGGTLLLITVGSVWKTASLAKGGSAVASLLGGRPVAPSTTETDERRLVNVVEEMALAAGTPVPEIYVLDQEDGINAFAAGFDSGDAVVAVTRGALEKLSRDELQGVIAHEMSHVVHGDMRLNVRLMGWIFGILVVALTGRMILHSLRFSGGGGRRRDGKGGGAIIIFMALALLVIGYVGVFFARMIQSAVSRQREFLADAAAVQYTRNPRGLAGALAKIAGTGSKLGTARAEEASHLFFANGLKAHWFSWMSTHPPLEERIRRLDPRGEYVQDLARGAAEAPAAAPASAATGAPVAAGAVAGLAPAAAAGPAEPPPERSVSDPERWVERAGNPEPRHIEYSAALLAAMPFELYSAVHSPEGAQALIYALLLDRRSESARQRQMEQLEEAAPAPVMARLRELLAQVEETPRRLYVPVVDLSLPALRRLSPDGYAAFRATVRRLAEADRRIDLFELAVERILLRHLDRHADPRRSDRPHHRTLSGLGLQVSLVLSALAHTGQDDAGRAKAAFDEAAAELADTGARLELIPDWETQPQVVGEALDQLYGATPELRRKLLKASVRAALSDRRVTAEEAELLRAVADALDCPIPPVLAEVGA